MTPYSKGSPDQASQSKDVIHFPDFKKLKAAVGKLRIELSKLVLERDELLLVECKNIEMAYMLTIGGLEYKAYEIECAILRLKRKVELIQARKNRQEKVIISEIDTILDVEFAEYQERLNEQIKRMNTALERSKGMVLTTEETRELKELYRGLVRALHPDLHPHLSQAKRQLFQNAISAYKNGDLNELRTISAMVAEPVFPKPNADAMMQFKKEKERLTKLIQTVQEQISKIKSEYPYTVKPIIRNKEKTAERKAELKDLIRQLKVTLGLYNAKIKEMMR